MALFLLLMLFHNAQDNPYSETKTTFLPSLPCRLLSRDDKDPQQGAPAGKCCALGNLPSWPGGVWGWPGGDRNPLKAELPQCHPSLTSFLEAVLNSRQHWKFLVVKAPLSQKPKRSFWFYSLSLPSAVDQREPLFPFLARCMSCKDRCNDSKGENTQSCITNQFISKQSTPALQICLQLLSAVLFLNCLQVADFSVVLLLPMYTQDLARHNFHYHEFKLPKFPAH